MSSTETREAQLHRIARAYASEGLAQKNFDAIPYDDHITLRAPFCPLTITHNFRALREQPKGQGGDNKKGAADNTL